MAAGTLYCGAGWLGLAYCCCGANGIIGGPPIIGGAQPAGPQPAPARAGVRANQQTTRQTLSASASLRMMGSLQTMPEGGWFVADVQAIGSAPGTGVPVKWRAYYQSVQWLQIANQAGCTIYKPEVQVYKS